MTQYTASSSRNAQLNQLDLVFFSLHTLFVTHGGVQLTFVEMNIWIFVCIFYLLKDISNHENVLLASPLHPADLDALFWKTLKNVQHMPYLIFAYWGLIFFLVAQIFYERYQQIIITCGADVKYQVWQMPNVLFLRYCYVQVLPTIKKCQIIADQWHQWWHSHILQWNDWRVCFNEKLFHYSPM